MMKVLITGAAGHLGSRFAEWILANVPDAEITGIDNLSCGYIENVSSQVRLLRMDVLDIDRITFDFDYVFHFAAYAAECLSPFIRRYNVRNNWEATTAVINAAINSGTCKRFVYTSSMSVYGRGESPFDETAACNPIDPYGVAKYAAETDLRIAGEQHGLDWCILRPHNLYGPGQSIWQRYRNVFGIWMSRHLQGLPMLVYGDGRQERAFSFIDDCLAPIWAAATLPGAAKQVINLGGEHPVALRDVADLLAGTMGGATIEHREARHEVQRAFCTVSKSQQLLGYVEQTSLEHGLREMWDWAQHAWQQFPARRQSHRVATVEVERGLYSYWKDSVA